MSDIGAHLLELTLGFSNISYQAQNEKRK